MIAKQAILNLFADKDEEYEDKIPEDEKLPISMDFMLEMKGLFKELDKDDGGTIDRQEFVECYGNALSDPEQVGRFFDRVDLQRRGQLDLNGFARALLPPEFKPYILPESPRPGKRGAAEAAKAKTSDELWRMRIDSGNRNGF